jgi:hypothetical protein
MSGPIKIMTLQHLYHMLDTSRADVEVLLPRTNEDALRATLNDVCKYYNPPVRWQTHLGIYILNNATDTESSTSVTVVGLY